ncbi:unnamed protein product [Soboliphyme baturini]|uniref:MYND-type domain-containing protein n=1 Tax=Soboliphyme baturini TaxID=241478 RepID=A0A183ISR3_9BILA|nr:unnamed protein product [Soboliphyme baturini]
MEEQAEDPKTKLFESIDKNDIAAVQDLLDTEKVKADCYKDVRNPDVCSLLLKAGAKLDVSNGIGRTATDLAAFTGQYRCICVLRNFIPFSDLEKYIISKGCGSSARLPPEIAALLYELLLSPNVHPVHVVLFLRHHPELRQYRKEVLYVTEDLMESLIKTSDCNEIMAFKFNIILHTLQEVFKFLEHDGENASKPDKDKLLTFAKSLLAVDASGKASHFNNFLIVAIQKFPFKQTVVYQQIVQETCTSSQDDCVPALDAINELVMGQCMATKETFCVSCGEPNSRLRCSSCKKDNYCSVECQKLHWFVHRRTCLKPSKTRAKDEPLAGQQLTAKATS